MAKIKLNQQNQVEMPTLILQNRNFENLGVLTDVTDFTFKENFNSANECSFTLYKPLITDSHTEQTDDIWNNIIDNKLLFIPEYEERFQITVSTDYQDTVTKSVTGTSLCESELSQVILRNIEINTETDILRKDYTTSVVFYNPNDTNNSLLHRILEKTPHYSISHVDESLMNLQRTIQLSDTDLYSALTGEIAEAFQCIFLFNSMNRTISAYDLYNSCKCGYRGDFSDKCPECGSVEFGGQYGTDTTVFISNENLAKQINLEADLGSLKNCFYIQGGDELINAAVASINPNGSQYIYHFSDETYQDMPKSLVDALTSYQEKYQYCTKAAMFLSEESIDTETSQCIESYNQVVQDIQNTFSDDKTVSFSQIMTPITGYSNISALLYETLDFYHFVKTSMMPTIRTDHMSLSESLTNIVNGFTNEFSNQISLTNPTSATQSTVEREILRLAKLFYSTAHYKLSLEDCTYTQSTDTSDGYWKGILVLTSLTETDSDGHKLSEKSASITLSINGDYESFIQQKLAKAMADRDTLAQKDIISISLTDAEFKTQLAFYSLDELENLQESFQSCLDIILTFQETDSELYENYYSLYHKRLALILDAISTRSEQVNVIRALYDPEPLLDSDSDTSHGILDDIRRKIQDELNLEAHLGTDLWKLFFAYRREDTYSNSNYISDGCDNAALLKKAKDLFSAADKELQRAGTLQYSISTTMNNLLALPEFAPFTDNFAVGNWIRVGIDDKIYKLRLLSYQINYEDIQSIQVEFSTVEKISDGISDVKSILDSARSMAGSYDGIKTLTENNSEKSKYVSTWINDGFRLTNQKIITGANNQNITIDEHGITAVKYDDYGNVDDCQLKIFNNGLYTTSDAWETIHTGIGKFIYLDPKEDFKEKIGYGVIADTIVSNIILSNEVGVYNSDGFIVLNNSGITITDSNKNVVMSADINGNAYFKGTITATDGEFTGSINTGSTITCGNNFKVLADGTLTATNAIISGTITATGGTIANWTITGNRIECDKTSDGGYRSGMQSASTSASAAFYAGTTTPAGGTIASQEASAFYVTQNGSLYANKATITGTINANTIKAKKNYYICDTDFEENIKIISSSPDNSSDTKYNFGRLSYNDYGSKLNYIYFKDMSDARYCEVVTDDFTAPGVAYSSDERLKNSFENLDAFDSAYMDLNPFRFKYNNGRSGRFHFGFGANETKKILEKHGFTTNDFAGFVQRDMPENNDEYEGLTDPMFLRYSEFIAWNTHMIQKLYKENEALKQRITKLEQAMA